MALHVKSFNSEHRDFDAQVDAWLNAFTQPIDVIVRQAGALTLVIARDAESPMVAAALLASTLLASMHAPSASPEGTRLPDDVNVIVDSRGGVWTLGMGNVVLLNNRATGPAVASKLLWLHANIYAFGTDSNWWIWRAETSGWEMLGPIQPV